jgi:hypothetical protein
MQINCNPSPKTQTPKPKNENIPTRKREHQKGIGGLFEG